MIDYSNYSEKDFIADEYFRSWVTKPDPELDSFWNSWLERYPEKSASIANAKSFILSIGYKVELPNTVKKESILNKVIAASEKEISKGRREKIQTINFSHLYKNAAVWVLLIVSVATFTYLISDNWQPKTVEVEQDIPYVRFTKAGEKLTLKLSDGSIVKLNSRSRIEVPSNFSRSRNVYLSGEAFFDIVRDTLNPFTVYNKDIEVKVLGTSFNINGKLNEDRTQIAVATGLVEVSSKYDKEAILLKPHEMLAYSKKKKVKTSFDPQKVLAWKDGILFFEGASLVEIAEELEDWYGIEVILQDDPKLKRKFTAKFKDKSLEEVLEGIQYTSDILYKIEEKKVYITSKN